MSSQVVKWASGIIVLITLSGFVGSTAVRMAYIEQEAEKVSGFEKQMKIMSLYMKLQDPILYHKAESLAN